MVKLEWPIQRIGRGHALMHFTLYRPYWQMNKVHYTWRRLGHRSCREVVDRQTPSGLHSGFTVWLYFHRLLRVWIWPPGSRVFPFHAFLGCQGLFTQSICLWGASFPFSPILPLRVGLSCQKLFQMLTTPWLYREGLSLSSQWTPAKTNLWNIYNVRP